MPIAIPHHSRVVKNLQQLRPDAATGRRGHAASPTLRLRPSVSSKNSASRSASAAPELPHRQPGRAAPRRRSPAGRSSGRTAGRPRAGSEPTLAGRTRQSTGQRGRVGGADECAGASAEVGHRALLDQAAVGDDDDVVDGLLDLLQQVAGDQHRSCPGRGRGGAGRRAASGCPRGRGRWPARRGPAAAGRRAATAASASRCRMPSRVAAGPLPGERRDPGQLEQLVDPARRRRPRPRRCTRRWSRPERPGCTSVASRAAPTTASGSVEVGVRPTVDGRGAGRRPDQAEQHPQRRGLARAVRAQEAGDPARRDREAQVVDGGQRAEPLGQSGGARRPHQRTRTPWPRYCHYRNERLRPRNSAMTVSSRRTVTS